ncbi:MAG: GntR family transcriptional regulator [Arachnia sp.]
MEKQSLARQVAAQLRSSIASEEYRPGTRLPTEFDLATTLGVSRSTVRSALKELAVLGLIHTEHGVGSFVVEPPAVRVGLAHLDSITESIRATGREPGMAYAHRVRRHVMPEEAAQMGVSVDTQIFEIRRTIFADREVLAFSYDLLPAAIFPAGFDIETLEGSLFAMLRERLGIMPHHAEADVHAVHSEHVGWGPDAAAHNLFVLLNQRHYDVTGMLIMFSRTYFIEGRYEFSIYRSL